MPKLIRMYIVQCLLGFAIAGVFVGVLFYYNLGNLWYLVTHTEIGPFAAVLFWLFNGIVFSGVQFGIAVMRLQSDDDDDTPGGGTRVPVRVRAEARRTRRI